MGKKVEMLRDSMEIIFCLFSLYIFIFVSEMPWIWTCVVCLMPLLRIVMLVGCFIIKLKDVKK